MSTYKILSIDAWGNSEDGYEWNDVAVEGYISSDVIDAMGNECILKWFAEQGYIKPEGVLSGELVDDGYNLVVVDRATGCPHWAIEYGN